MLLRVEALRRSFRPQFFNDQGERNQMGMINEFKAFAVRGNVIDMAVGIIIGAAFTKIVSSFVADVVTPPLGMLIGGVDFSDLAIVLKQAVGDTPAVTLSYGRFIQTMFDFTIVAFAIFLAVKGINSLKRKEAAAPSAPPAPSKEEVLLTEIRDALRAQNRP
jgi:large conductance mechanosensitive channel